MSAYKAAKKNGVGELDVGLNEGRSRMN